LSQSQHGNEAGTPFELSNGWQMFGRDDITACGNELQHWPGIFDAGRETNVDFSEEFTGAGHYGMIGHR
jgi:hypothetical protein